LNKLKEKNSVDIKKDISESRDKLWSLRVDLAAGKVKNVAEIRAIKRSIARMLTRLSSEKTDTSS